MCMQKLEPQDRFYFCILTSPFCTLVSEHDLY
jgi:hypothetical protein